MMRVSTRAPLVHISALSQWMCKTCLHFPYIEQLFTLELPPHRGSVKDDLTDRQIDSFFVLHAFFSHTLRRDYSVYNTFSDRP
jgi:hypothetical protein